MKKVLCLSDRLGYRGGAERQLSGLAYFLSQKGYEVKVCTYLKQSTPSILEINYGMRYVCLDNSGSKWSKLWSVYRYIKIEKFDVIIAYKDGPCMISCILKAFGVKSKLIVSERNTTQNINRLTKIKFWLFKFADFIVPNSYSQGNYIKKNYPKLYKKTSVIINYVDENKFYPHNLRNKSGEIVRCIVVASIKEQKNPLNLIEALNILKNDNLQIRVDWYGNANNKVLYKKCIDKIEELGLNEYIRLFPAEEEIHKIYPKYDMMCLPSLYEGFPNALCEAMSCGLPVVASNVCDNPIILNYGEYGILFNPLSPLDIAVAFKKMLLKDKNSYPEIGQKCRERIISLCSEKEFLNKYQILINE